MYFQGMVYITTSAKKTKGHLLLILGKNAQKIPTSCKQHTMTKIIEKSLKHSIYQISSYIWAFWRPSTSPFCLPPTYLSKTWHQPPAKYAPQLAPAPSLRWCRCPWTKQKNTSEDSTGDSELGRFSSCFIGKIQLEILNLDVFHHVLLERFNWRFWTWTFFIMFYWKDSTGDSELGRFSSCFIGKIQLEILNLEVFHHVLLERFNWRFWTWKFFHHVLLERFNWRFWTWKLFIMFYWKDSTGDYKLGSFFIMFYWKDSTGDSELGSFFNGLWERFNWRFWTWTFFIMFYWKDSTGDSELGRFSSCFIGKIQLEILNLDVFHHVLLERFNWRFWTWKFFIMFYWKDSTGDSELGRFSSCFIGKIQLEILNLEVFHHVLLERFNWRFWTWKFFHHVLLERFNWRFWTWKFFHHVLLERFNWRFWTWKFFIMFYWKDSTGDSELGSFFIMFYWKDSTGDSELGSFSSCFIGKIQLEILNLEVFSSCFIGKIQLEILNLEVFSMVYGKDSTGDSELGSFSSCFIEKIQLEDS